LLAPRPLNRTIPIIWPRETGGGWVEDWLLLMTLGAITLLSLIYMQVSGAWQGGNAPAGDAISSAQRPRMATNANAVSG